jgi:hypothetical protein
MNNTAQIDVSLYGCYYVHESLEPFKIYTRHPDGDMEYTEYDTFTADDKTLIAFKNFNFSVVDYNYVLVSNGVESLIQWSCYEFVREYINESTITEDCVYTVLNSVSMPNLRTSDYNPIISYENRCDNETYGGKPYAMLDGVKDSSVNPETVNGQTIKLSLPLINSVGDAHIVYFKMVGQGTDYRDWPGVTRMSKSFVGAVKLLIEWASLKEEPFNSTEEIVLDCASLLEKLEIGQDIIDEFIATQEDMPLYRYLKGMNNARSDFEESTTIGPLFDNWLKSKVRYVSLNSLVANYPKTINIDSNVLEQERVSIEADVYKYCIMMQIDFMVITPKEALNIIEYPSIWQSENLSRSDTFKARKALLSYMSYS